jgi:hypothetical protein
MHLAAHLVSIDALELQDARWKQAYTIRAGVARGRGHRRKSPGMHRLPLDTCQASHRHPHVLTEDHVLASRTVPCTAPLHPALKPLGRIACSNDTLKKSSPAIAGCAWPAGEGAASDRAHPASNRAHMANVCCLKHTSAVTPQPSGSMLGAGRHTDMNLHWCTTQLDDDHMTPTVLSPRLVQLKQSLDLVQSNAVVPPHFRSWCR